MRNDKTRHKYLVGYEGDNQCVYGKDFELVAQWADPLTLKQAVERIKELDGNSDRHIYKLVSVARITPPKKKAIRAREE